MKMILIIALVLALLVLLIYIVMAIQSQKEPSHLGLQNNMLAPCPNTPNCVCSENHTQDDKQHYINPISADEHTWQQLQQLIIKQGGKLQTQHEDYLHFTFTSSIFRYVDDVELRQDNEQGLIHLRSASRVGKTDFAANRQRLIKLQQAL